MYEFLSLINLIGLIYLIVVVHRLKGERTHQNDISKNLEELIDSTKSNLDQKEKEPAALSDSSHEATSQDGAITRFMRWYAHDWPLKTGAFFILLGFVWLATYAFLNNWIGPVGRITFGLVVGCVVLAWGAQRLKKDLLQGEVISALGGGIISITIYSAQYVLERQIFHPYVALFFIALLTVLLAGLSYIFQTKRLAVLAYIAGASAPFLTGGESRSALGLFAYLGCLTLGTTWLVRITGWRLLTLISLCTIWFYTSIWLHSSLSPSNLIYIRFFSVSFSIFFYLLSLMAFVYDRKANQADTYTGTLIGLYSFHWIMTIMPHEWRSLIFVAFAVVFISGAHIINRLYDLFQPVFLYTAIGIVMLVAATMIEFSGEMLPVVLATEAFVLMIYTDKVYRERISRFVLLLFLMPIIGSIQFFVSFKHGISVHSAMLYVNFILYAAAYYLTKYANPENIKNRKSDAKIITIISALYSLSYIWTVTPYFLGVPTNGYYYVYENLFFLGHALALTVFALIGISIYIFGYSTHRHTTNRFGFWLTIFVIVRLMLVEVWEMDLAPRIGVFFVIGIIFMSSVFVRKYVQKN